MEILECFVSCWENPNARIDLSITKASTEVVNRNRKCLSSILYAIQYCGCQGLALSGHRDDGSLFNDEGLIVNRGNFNELIIFMSELDSDLKEYMLSSKRNTTYLSKTSQNDLLACVKEYTFRILGYLLMKLPMFLIGNRWV